MNDDTSEEGRFETYDTDDDGIDDDNCTNDLQMRELQTRKGTKMKEDVHVDVAGRRQN